MNNDLNNDLGNDDVGFDDFDSAEKKSGGTLGDLWRNNSLFKIGVVAGGLIVLIFAFFAFGGKSEEVASSNVPSGPEVASKPGEEGASQAYIEAVVDDNTERFEEALTTGGSAIPTPIDSRDAILSLGENFDENAEEDPLDRWRRLQEERAQIALAAPVTPQVSPEQVAAKDEALQALADLMSEQMGTILEASTQTQINSLTYTDPAFLETLNAEEEATAAAAQTAETEETLVTLLAAGEIEYAQLITEANSDVPGPILARIAGGPLSGAKVLGSFSVAKELLTLNFNTIVIDDVAYPITAVALDPGTTLPGVATDVDHHYFARIALPAAAAFIEGFSSAISESGLTTVTVEGETVATETGEASNDQEVASGIEEAGSELSEIVDDITSDLETTVIVAAGTPIGLLFTAPVQVPESAIE
jgi:intracellular multiplication protein IcmE